MMQRVVGLSLRSSHFFRFFSSELSMDSPLLHYTVHGQTAESATSSLLIAHGLLGSSGDSNDMSKMYIEEDIFDQVIQVDMRNHGQSFHNSDFSVNAVRGDIHRLIEHIDPPSDFTIMGSSQLGGKIAIEMALRGELKPSTKLIAVDSLPRSLDMKRTPYPRVIEAMLAVDISKKKRRKDVFGQLCDELPEQKPEAINFFLDNLEHGRDSWEWRIHLESVKAHLEEYGDFPKELQTATTKQETLFILSSNPPPRIAQSISRHFTDSTISVMDTPKSEEILRIVRNFRNGTIHNRNTFFTEGNENKE